MRALLDINLLIALSDEDHLFHATAHNWYQEHQAMGWASCPITENGMVRIMSNPNYNPVIRRPAAEIIQALKNFTGNSNHEFWPGDISLSNPSCFDPQKILGSRQITDLYLLGLATRYGGRFVTFGTGINFSAVLGAQPANLYVIQ
jgi:uncharacterized protein